VTLIPPAAVMKLLNVATCATVTPPLFTVIVEPTNRVSVLVPPATLRPP
jgi:hypothetical protein